MKAASSVLIVVCATLAAGQALGEEKKLTRISIDARHFSKDKSVNIDYPIVYVRSPRWVR